jgi:hypothetical protein
MRERGAAFIALIAREMNAVRCGIDVRHPKRFACSISAGEAFLEQMPSRA